MTHVRTVFWIWAFFSIVSFTYFVSALDEIKAKHPIAFGVILVVSSAVVAYISWRAVYIPDVDDFALSSAKLLAVVIVEIGYAVFSILLDMLFSGLNKRRGKHRHETNAETVEREVKHE